MVSDFGVALRSSDVTLTADGTVIGTPPFMSPERDEGHVPSEYWSLCAGASAAHCSDS